MAQAAKKERIPLQVAGQPQGKHITGFKGSKTDELCLCGKCHPNAKANHGRVVVYDYSKK